MKLCQTNLLVIEVKFEQIWFFIFHHNFFSCLKLRQLLVKEGQENEDINYVAETTEFICVVYVFMFFSCFVFSGNNLTFQESSKKLFISHPSPPKKLFIIYRESREWFLNFHFCLFFLGVRNFSGKKGRKKGWFVIISIL